MKKILAVFLLLCVCGFIAWKSDLRGGPTFIVKTKKGQIFEATNLFIEPRGLWEDSDDETFTVYIDYGSFKVRKDLKDVASIEVLDDSGLTLKLTNSKGQSTKVSRLLSSNFPRPFDWVNGQSGEVQVYLPLWETDSITRK